jgi:hypothetical protein
VDFDWPEPLVVTPLEVLGHSWDRKETLGQKPYDGLFKIGLMMEGGPTRWEVCDLRGERCWTERVFCLLCSDVLE